MANKTKIEWTDYTWNPITGCLHNCYYCYARKIGMRFDGHFKPTFHPKRLDGPSKIKKPSKIFVGSMSDVFGVWVPREWIEAIIEITKENPHHTFQFLTKNPIRYLDFEFPDNCWLGITIDYNVLGKRRLNCLKAKKPKHSFISFEPLLGDMSDLDIKWVDLVIIGAMTGPGSIPPEKAWIRGIKHPNIFIKDNIKKYL